MGFSKLPKSFSHYDKFVNHANLPEKGLQKKDVQERLKKGPEKENSSIKHNQMRVKVFATRSVPRLLWINFHCESCCASEDVKSAGFWAGEAD